MVQAPVAAVGSVDVGSKHGAHTSNGAQTSAGRRSAFSAIEGRQVDRQRPSAPATEVQVLGTKLPAVAMSGSGAQKPPVHVARSGCSAAGTGAPRPQCDAP